MASLSAGRAPSLLPIALLLACRSRAAQPRVTASQPPLDAPSVDAPVRSDAALAARSSMPNKVHVRFPMGDARLETATSCAFDDQGLYVLTSEHHVWKTTLQPESSSGETLLALDTQLLSIPFELATSLVAEGTLLHNAVGSDGLRRAWICLAAQDKSPLCVESGRESVTLNTLPSPLRMHALQQLVVTERYRCALGLDHTLHCVGNDAPRESDSHYVAATSIDLPAIDEVSAQGESICVRSNSSVSCWGDNHLHQVSANDTNDVQSPIPVSLPSVRQIAVARTHACAIAADKSTFCWGLGAPNKAVQLKLEPAEQIVVDGMLDLDSASPTQSAEGETCIRTTTGHVQCVRHTSKEISAPATVEALNDARWIALGTAAGVRMLCGPQSDQFACVSRAEASDTDPPRLIEAEP